MLPGHLPYLLAGGGVAIVYSSATGFAHYFITTRLGVAPAAAAVQVAVLQVSVLVVDLLAGQVAGRLQSRHGGWHPLMLGGAGIAVAGLVTLFAVSPIAGTMAVAVALGGFACVLAGLSAFCVVHLARIAELAPDPRRRPVFVSHRMLCMALGALIGGAVPPYLVAYWGAETGWARTALLSAAVALPLMIAGARGPAYIPAATHWHNDLRALVADWPFVAHLGGAVVMFMVGSTVATAAPFFVSWTLGLPLSALSVLLGAQAVANLVAMRFWPLAVARLGAVATLCLAQAVQAAGLVLLVALPGVAGLGVAAAMVGAGGAGLMVISYAMLSDLTMMHQRRTGVDRSTAMAGVWMAAEKIYGAGGRLLAGTLLGLAAWLGRDGAAIAAMVIAPLALSVMGIAIYVVRERRAPMQEVRDAHALP